MISSRNSYCTDFKLAVQLGVIPKYHIPKSTYYNFINSDYSKLFGIEHSSLYKQDINLAREIIQSDSLKKFFRALILIKNTIIKIHYKYIPNIKKIYRLNRVKEKIIAVIKRVKPLINLTEALQYFKITKTTYYRWLNKKRCPASLLKKCFRIHPNQLTTKEVYSIKYLINDVRFKYWPLISIYYYGIRNKILFINKKTFYKYTKLLGFKRIITKNPNKNKTGIRTSAPNLLWHCDITIVKLLDNTKAYVYIVMDNFSRKILSIKTALSVSAQICFDNLRHAYENYGKSNEICLLTDGGAENNNQVIDNYLSQPEISIRKIIAQQDVSFSNSMIEAVNKIIKHNYLFKVRLSDFNALDKYLDEFIPDYNNRPHCSLKGLTPDEVYNGVINNDFDYKNQIKMAMKKRIIQNKQQECENHE